jgi:hypothetical protein
VKLIRANNNSLAFRLTRAEKQAFTHLLELYPLVPASHQRLTKGVQEKAVEEGQQLLDEALAAQRAANRRQIDDWLKLPERFKAAKSGFSFTLMRSDVEWLLQVLNDIRVGSWLLLGSPDEPLDPEEVPKDLTGLWAAMEITGLFQMRLLHAAEGRPLE